MHEISPRVTTYVATKFSFFERKKSPILTLFDYKLEMKDEEVELYFITVE